MRVVFMGTPQFAVASLDAIVLAGHTVALVVSAPDRPKGRGLKYRGSEVKQRATELGIPVTTPENLRDPLFIEEVVLARPDIICVVAFRILPPEIYEIPTYGSFNLHGSLLPRYRGAAPINRAIMAGESRTGVTTFMLRRKVDTGAVLIQREIPITPEMTAGELHDQMMVVGASVVVETLALIANGTAVPYDQDNRLATPAPKIFREDCRINWGLDALTIHNHIRGLSPFPGAFTTYRGTTLKILRGRVLTSDDTEAEYTPSSGEIFVLNGCLLVGTHNGILEIVELQQEGSKPMLADAFIRGRPFGVSTKLGT